MTLEISLPRQLEANSFRRVSEEIPRAGALLPDEAKINFSGLQFVSPVGVTYLSNLVNWMESYDTKVTLVPGEAYGPAIAFLDDSLFFQKHMGHKLRFTAKPRSTTQPLQEIAHENSHAWLDMRLTPWLAATLGLPKSSLRVFQTCLAEIFNNIKDHSDLDIGCIFVQHFPNIHEISISIADFGVGIPTTVRRVRPSLSDVPAIVAAVQLGFTSGTLPTNRGAGLAYLLQNVVLENKGKLSIFSLDGAVVFTNSMGVVAIRSLKNTGFCPGTTIEISLRTDTIPLVDDEEEELEW